ncbi:ATP-dependent DNA ligase [Sphingomonas natans]|uniref:ATP-dependent DNA ligase n=1 Tax=Sphingomonas natans TaxID=3063330 RepID=UPI003133980C
MARTRSAKSHDGSAGASAAPPFQPVQLAKLVDHVPVGNAWLHELKFDGYRCLLSVGASAAHAFTRSGLDWSDKFDAIVADALSLPARSALIDGEVVVIDDDGRTNFQALQSAIKGAPARLEYYAFDLLHLDGEDLTGRPLTERKAKLAALLKGHDGVIHYSDHIVG